MLRSMDLGNPWILFSGIIIGLVGMLMFNYGRKEPDLRVLSAGIVLCIYPYFVGSLIILWLVFAAVVGGLYAMSKYL